MPPSRKMSLPFDQRIKPERRMQLKVALMNYAREENKKQQGKQTYRFSTYSRSAAHKVKLVKK